MYLDDMNTAMEFDIPAAHITRERMIEFAKLYDPFPLHHDDEFAKNTRFGQLVAPGVMSFMSIWANFIRLNVLGDELIAGKSTKIEWFKPVFAGLKRHCGGVREVRAGADEFLGAAAGAAAGIGDDFIQT